MGRSWDVSTTVCEPRKSNDQPKENQKKCPIKVIQTRCVKLESLIQSEVRQKEKHQYSMLMHICGIKEDGNDDFIWKAAKETQI